MTSTVCLLAKNEERAVAEWLAFQFVIGFDKVIVYDNGSTDGTAKIVNAVAAIEPNVMYVSWPDRPDRRPQPTAYADAISKCVTDWIAFFDTDEFFVPRTAETVNGFLANMPSEASGVAINWLVFGSGGLLEPGNGLVIDRFTRCAGPHQHRTRICKTFVRPEDVREMLVHTAILSKGRYVNSLGEEISIEHNSKTPEVCFAGAHLNHYLLKSRQEFLLKKARGHASRTPLEKDKFTHIDEDFWSRNDLNDGEDLSVLRWREAVVAKLMEWKSAGAIDTLDLDAGDNTGPSAGSAAATPAQTLHNIEISTANYNVTRYHVDYDKLVVIFASAGKDGLGEPIEEFKTSLHGFGMSTLFVIERIPKWYNHVDTLEVLGSVGRIAQRYKNIAVLGESMGGAGALNFSRFCRGVGRILALVPQYSLAQPYINFDAGQAPHGRLPQNFWSFAAPEARPVAQILYGNTDWKDAVHAGMYLVEGFNVHFVVGAGHGVAQHLKRHGKLRLLLASFLDFETHFSAQSIEEAIGSDLYTRRGIVAPHRFADYAAQQHSREVALAKPQRLPGPPGYVDLAVGGKTDQSSVSRWSHGKTTREDSARAVSGHLKGNYAFHTDLEERPWWSVDFSRRVSIVEVRLYNRIDAHKASTRCLRFAIERAMYADDEWQEVWRKDDDVWFGGADGRPFIWCPEKALFAHRIRIRLLGKDFLHFASIEIFGTESHQAGLLKEIESHACP